MTDKGRIVTAIGISITPFGKSLQETDEKESRVSKAIEKALSEGVSIDSTEMKDVVQFEMTQEECV